MKFLRTVVRDFSGFKVSGIKELEHKWVAPTQVIIGANGYGKTRYMKTCTPNPLTKTHFGPGGYHERLIDHNGSIFRLVSDYSNKGLIHTFQINSGPNLNEGGTSTVQADLIRQYLGYTPTVNALVFNTLDIASMKPAERRQFFMELLPSTDHFLYHHKAIVSKIRSLTGTIATLTERKTQLESQILSDEEYTTLRRSVETQLADTSSLLSSITKLEVVLSQLEHTTGDYTSLLRDAHIEVVKRNNLYTLGLWHNVLSDDSISRLTSDISIQSNTLEQIDKDIRRLLEVIETKTNTLNVLTADISEAELIRLKSELVTMGDVYTSPPWSLQHLTEAEEIQPTLLAYLTDIVDTTVVIMADDTQKEFDYAHRSLRSQITDLRQSIADDTIALNAARNKLSDTLAVPSACEIFVCPLRQKVTELTDNRTTAIGALERTIEHKTDKLQELERELDIVITKLDASTKSRAAVSDILAIVKRLMPISKDDLISKLMINPLTVYHEFRGICTKGINSIKAHNLRQRIAELDSKLSACAIIGADPTELRRQLESHECELNKLRDNHARVRRNISHLQNTLYPLAKNISNMRTAHASLEQRLRASYDIAMREHDFMLVKSIYDFMSVAYKDALLQLAKDETILRDQDGLKSRLRDEVLVTIAHCEKDLALSKKIEVELSPNTGMPFAHMRQFLNRVFATANALMAVVFVYPIRINPIEVDTGLTYKFTATINNEHIDDDISECSSAQVAIMNTCLALAVKKVIGLGDYPFFLDEVGNRFDPQHKTRLIYLLDHIVQGKYASQLFVINHDVVIHGGLSSSDIVALSTINVILPSVYNEHVIMST